MEIKYIVSEIDELICKALQDYLSLVVNNNWQEKLFSIAEDAVINNHFKSKYIAVYNTLVDMDDISKFATSDMDVTLIVSVVYYRHDFVNIKDETREALYHLSQDRNQSGHSTKNETPDELFERGISALRNLEVFIRSVDNNEDSIPKNERSKYRNQYMNSIKRLRESLREERDYISQKRIILKDIQRILESNDPPREWLKVSKPYFEDKLLTNKEDFYAFITEAAKAGIVQAYPIAGDYYYHIVHDYDLAEKYLSYLYINRKDKQYDNPYMLLLANIYLNKLSEHSGDDKSIVNMLIAEGHSIKLAKDGKSYVFCQKASDKDSLVDPISKYITGMGEVVKILNENRIESIQSKSENNNKKNTYASSSETPKKSGLTVGGTSGSKKMRLGRVPPKKSNPDSTTEQSKKSGISEREVLGSKKMRLGKKHPRKPSSSTNNNEKE